MFMVQQQYLADLHDNFVAFVGRFVAFVDSYMLLPQATENYKTELENFKVLLKGKDVEEIVNNLADGAQSGILKKGTIEKIEKFDKELVDFIFEHISAHSLWKEIFKQLSIIRIEQEKDATIKRLNELQIPVV